MKTSTVAVLGLLAAGALAQADVFDKPPEIYGPVWWTAFPYQRNINMGFGVSPVGSAGPGIPGAVYEGYLDPSLKVSDYVSFTSDVQWYNNLSGFTKTGFIGIDNRLGTSTLSGSASFRLDNLTVNGLGKHVWLELDEFMTPGNSSFGFGVLGPSGYLWSYLGGVGFRSAGDGFWRVDWEFETSPNPPWETVYFSFNVVPGAVVVFDNLHIATECIPEPGAVWLVLLGLSGLAIRHLRRKAG